MCGIAGLVCLAQRCREEDHLRIVRKMCDLHRHRGPDDNGLVSLGHVCLGSNRLSIIDLSDAGHMPMANEEERWWISYNGEVYNFEDLREELARRGHKFRSRTDTEVVLHAFTEWGDDCLERFVGMFAFAIYDKNTDTLILARDRFGKKPLYYTSRDGHVLFASEMKALMGVCDGLRVNHHRLIEWSLYRNVDFGSPETLVADVFSLPPGHILKVRRGQMDSARPYYLPQSEIDPALYERFESQPGKETVAAMESLIVSSVKDRLVSDVPVGTFCSGGVDSSLITAICSRSLKHLMTFNVSLVGYEKLDENRYARQVAEFLGIRLLTCTMDGESFRRNLARAIYFSDVPLTHPNSVAFLLLSEYARRHGAVVLLSGEGADELFGGYVHRHRRYGQLLRIRRLLQYVPEKIRKGLTLAGAASNGIPITQFSDRAGLLDHTISFLDKFAREDLRLRSEEAYGFVSDPTERAVLGAMLADLTDYLTPLLRRLDRMSMAASVECRVPYLDHRLVETVINLPLSYRLRRSTDKWILKEIATRYLPQKIVYRKKVGFPLPLADFLAPLAEKDLFRGGFCLEFLGMHPRGVMEAVTEWKKNVEGFFNLLALEIWGRLFFLRQPLEEVSEQFSRVCQNASGYQTASQPHEHRQPERCE